jgi:nucleoside 2-deoxyribosyltransferase
MASTYLCGGINGLSDADCRNWRDYAKAKLATPTLDPMRRDYRGREAECAREIVEEDLRDIRTSQYVLVNATRPSWGTAMEVYFASEHGKTVIAWVAESVVSPWLRYHCAEIHGRLDGAIGSINRRSGC